LPAADADSRSAGLTGYPWYAWTPAVSFIALPAAYGHAGRAGYQRHATGRVLNDLDSRIERVDGILKILDSARGIGRRADDFDQRTNDG